MSLFRTGHMIEVDMARERERDPHAHVMELSAAFATPLPAPLVRVVVRLSNGRVFPYAFALSSSMPATDAMLAHIERYCWLRAHACEAIA